MPSLVAEYTYDIFISYRQKDNRADQWVTNFVQALRDELDATFKEEISIYFDSNPHDGLLETHDVDRSLKEKIHCLIFIPIVSQTYCDPNSFAWQNEFIPFIEFARGDQFGLDIKLANGNTAKRVLPIRIHQIDLEDQLLFEDAIGGVMRPVDFIYSAAGVNRPLRSLDDEMRELAHSVLYRDQINKVAIAIKELIASMRSMPDEKPLALSVASNVLSKRPAANKTKLYSWAALVLIIVFFSYLYYTKINVSGDSASETSIAVIPFLNNTGNDDLDFYGMGVASEIRTQLALAKQFDFISSMQATAAYRNTTERPDRIGDKLGVTHLLTGMYQGTEDNLQVIVEMVESSSGKIIWSLPLRTHAVDFFKLQERIAREVTRRFDSEINVEVAGTNDLQALAECSKGFNLYLNSSDPKDGLKAIPFFERAIKRDSGYLDAWYGMIEVLAYHYFQKYDDPTVKREDINELVAYVNANFKESWKRTEVNAVYAYWVERNFNKAAGLYLRVLEQNPDAYSSNSNLAAIYKHKLNHAKALKYRRRALKQNPNPVEWRELGIIYSHMGNKKLAIRSYLNAYDLNQDMWRLLYEACRSNGFWGDLPSEIKQKHRKRYTVDSLSAARRFAQTLSFLHRIKPDSTMDALMRTRFLSTTHYILQNDDSAKFYANEYVECVGDSLKKQRDNSVGLHIMRGILNAPSDWRELSTKPAQQFDDDFMFQAWEIIRNIFYCTAARRFSEATEKLKTLNDKFPQWGYYSWLSLPIFDRIKEEYPPFVGAINSLKLPPKLSQLERVKM